MDNNMMNQIRTDENGGVMQNRGRDVNMYKTQTAANAMNFTTPPQMSFDTEQFKGSIQQALAENIGEFIVVEFLIGTQFIVRKQGILQHVGISYCTLFDDQLNNFILCDMFSIKFVYFYFPGDRPKRNYNILPSNTNGNLTGR